MKFSKIISWKVLNLLHRNTENCNSQLNDAYLHYKSTFLDHARISTRIN